MYFLPVNEVKESDFNSFKALNYIKDGFLLITWVVATFNNKSAVADVDLEPDEEDENHPKTALNGRQR